MVKFFGKFFHVWWAEKGRLLLYMEFGKSINLYAVL